LDRPLGLPEEVAIDPRLQIGLKARPQQDTENAEDEGKDDDVPEGETRADGG
jgi:hypothetical protein